MHISFLLYLIFVYFRLPNITDTPLSRVDLVKLHSFIIPLGEVLLGLVEPARQRNSLSLVGGQHLVHHVSE